MKNFLLVTLICISTNLFAQTVQIDSILMQKASSGGYQFYQGTQKVKLKQLIDIMRPNDQAYQQIKSAQSANIWGGLMASVSGALIGWPIGTALEGGDPKWVLAGIGAGLFVLSVPISQTTNKKAKQAIDTFNQGLQANSSWDSSEIKLSIVGNGLGFTLSF